MTRPVMQWTVGAWHAVLMQPRSTPPTDPLGSVVQNPDAVRDAACRLVESREVCSPPSAPPSLPRTPGTGSAGGGGLLGVMLWALLILVVIALAFVAQRYLRDRRPQHDELEGEAEDPDTDGLAGTVVIDRSREPRGWREEAEAHRSAGRYRDALRCRYRALVGDLARGGLLHEIPGRTTGEERRELGASAPVAVPAFGEAADLFDAAWYGRLEVDAADDDRFQALDRDVLTRTAVGSRHARRPEGDRP
jgi:hypothetical protein